MFLKKITRALLENKCIIVGSRKHIVKIIAMGDRIRFRQTPIAFSQAGDGLLVDHTISIIIQRSFSCVSYRFWLSGSSVFMSTGTPFRTLLSEPAVLGLFLPPTEGREHSITAIYWCLTNLSVP